MRTGLASWAVGSALLLTGCTQASLPTNDTGASAAATATNRFGFDLYDRLRRTAGNLVFSPASAEVALAMASAGARGETLEQMAHVLHMNPATDHSSFGSLLASLNARDGGDGLSLHVADKLWGQIGVPFQPAFLTILREMYRAPLSQVDFAHATEAARIAINEWAAKETHDRIVDLVPEGALKPSTRVAIGSAVYFKGSWRFAFPGDSRITRDFVTDRGRAPVSMMRQYREFAYAHVDGVGVVELPYGGGLSMLVVLSDAVDGLTEVERRIGGEYDRWVAAASRRIVDLELPEWKVFSAWSLLEPLRDMGMRLAFSQGDFSPMGDVASLDAVVQKAFVEVNGKGTEAAAATLVAGTPIAADVFDPPPPPPAVFHADHPFLYVIRDSATRAILFIGRVVDPR